MNPLIILALLDGALTMVEKLTPVVKGLFAKGDITVEQQQALLDRIAALSKDDAFSGPQWKPDP